MHPTTRAVAVVAVLGCALAAALLARPAGAPAAGSPNIVVIQTDDMRRTDLYTTYPDPLTGQPLAVMPNTLNLLAAQGIIFTRYYVSNPLCCPSRTTLLTGRYSHNNGVLTNFFPSGGYYKFDTQNNLAAWLQNAGYKTSHVGKFLNQYGERDSAEEPPGWNDWHTVLGDARVFYGYKMNDNGTVSDPHGAFDEATKTYPAKDPTSCPDTPGNGECNYLTDVITNDALDAIDKYGAHPFYLQVDYTTPHGDIVSPAGPEPAPRYSASLTGIRAPRGRSFNEYDVSDKPSFVRSNPRLGFGQIDAIDRSYENRLEALRSVDDGVAKIINRLSSAGNLGNTYIVFISDNGFFQGEHRYDSSKFLPYEPSNHLPLVIRGPGIAPGISSRELVGNVDLAPTFLQIAGGQATATMDGRSLMPFMADPAKRTKRPLLLEGFTGRLEPGVPLRAASPRDYEGVRIAQYKYIEYRSGGRELYDLRRDPNETQSLRKDPRYRNVKRRLSALLARLERCAADGCRRPVKRKIPPPLPKHRHNHH